MAALTLQPVHLKRLALGVNLLLVVGIGYSAANLAWRLMGDIWREPPDGSATAARPANGPAAPQTLANLVELHLFGAGYVGGEVPLDAPESRLNLEVLGIFAGSDEGKSGRVLIKSPNEGEISYPVGAQLPGGVTVRAIHPDRVVLEHNGRFETLRLPKSDLSLKGKGEGGKPQKAASRATEQQDPALTAAVRDFRKKLNEKPEEILNQVRIDPVREDERFIGFRLTPAAPEFLAPLQLNTGDIVTAVNDIVLDAPMKGMEALRQLNSAREVNLRILRDGQTKMLHFVLGP
ncbi:MAG: type II secretion system protein GspC [Magnetococcales bacterium]|nr:type II secretion system protein GspC [Magnetococcales bacterium]